MITGTTKLLGFFADPSSHSNSPLMYNTAFEKLGLDMRYLAFTVGKESIGDAVNAMRTLDMVGANVSMPNKTEVIKYLDDISEEARLCGAVNTIVNRNGHLTGYNTDIYGAMKALKEIGAEIKGKDFMLFGLGGAGKAILTGLGMEGANKVSLFLRREPNKDETEFVEKIENATGCKVEFFNFTSMIGKLGMTFRPGQVEALINATNVGMGKLEGQSLVPDNCTLPAALKVMDIIYHPEETELMKQVKEAGCKGVCNGLSMLIYQGEAAFKLYTGLDMPVDDVRRAIMSL